MAMFKVMDLTPDLVSAMARVNPAFSNAKGSLLLDGSQFRHVEISHGSQSKKDLERVIEHFFMHPTAPYRVIEEPRFPNRVLLQFPSKGRPSLVEVIEVSIDNGDVKIISTFPKRDAVIEQWVKTRKSELVGPPHSPHLSGGGTSPPATSPGRGFTRDQPANSNVNKNDGISKSLGDQLRDLLGDEDGASTAGDVFSAPVRAAGHVLDAAGKVAKPVVEAAGKVATGVIRVADKVLDVAQVKKVWDAMNKIPIEVVAKINPAWVKDGKLIAITDFAHWLMENPDWGLRGLHSTDPTIREFERAFKNIAINDVGIDPELKSIKASMGPRHRNRGKWKGGQHGQMGSGASMGPRHRNRGKRMGNVGGLGSQAGLQWGRGIETAERIKAFMPSRPFFSLQWGRGIETAESRREATSPTRIPV